MVRVQGRIFKKFKKYVEKMFKNSYFNNFDKYEHTTHVIITTMFQGLFKYIKGRWNVFQFFGCTPN